MRFVWAPVNWATGSLSKWIVVAVAAVTSGLALTIVGAATLENDPVAGLPADAESTGLTRLQQQLPSSQVEPALVVYSRLGGLTEQDRTAIDASRRDLAQAALGGRVAPPVQAADGTAAFVIVPLSANLSDEDLRAAVEDIRATAQAVSPSGLSAQVTGAPAFEVDIGAVFDGADITLLLTTAAVVAVLLLLTYRSPWLWLVPLTVIVVADQMAAKLVSILTQLTGLDVDAATVGITSVLVFGAGTNYALLIIARYREELRQLPDRHQAMRRALHSAAPAIIASSGTVVLALLTLLFAVSPLERSLGVTGAVGIAVAVLYALVVLPAVLLLFGRGLFWPFTPRVGQPDPTRTGPWSKVGAAVVRRPRTVIAASLLLLAALGLGGIGLKTGLSQTEQFRTSVEATEGQQTLARSFPAGGGHTRRHHQHRRGGRGDPTGSRVGTRGRSLSCGCDQRPNHPGGRGAPRRTRHCRQLPDGHGFARRGSRGPQRRGGRRRQRSRRPRR